MNIVKFLVFGLFFALPSSLLADEENPWYIEGALTHFGAKDGSEVKSLNGKELFVSTPVSGSGFAGYTLMYHDESLYNYFIGGAYEVENDQVGYLQFGLGVGKIDFKDYDDFFTINPWVYWERGRLLVDIHTEYIPTESNSLEWFWRPEIRYDIGKEDAWYIGGYGERWLGYGPTVGFTYKWATFRVTFLFGTDPGRERMLGATSFASQ